ncbi:hypothetical protein CAEBREN_21933 [Caenorhabditis brenneri]|uniref:Uncharacterized protein n=1 Tax=Caenorhabditis brenneri TaxID=135651 RepID=G0NS29_CAEBE|nr:hypothetical protein CAEBREN_21933 [Caenorhabditis brenneri]
MDHKNEKIDRFLGKELSTATVIDCHPVQHQLLLSLLKRHLDGQQDQEQEPAKKKSDGAEVQNDPAGHEDDDAQSDGGEPEVCQQFRRLETDGEYQEALQRDGIIDATEIYVHHEEVVYAEDDQDDVVDSEPDPSDEERHDEEDAHEE